MPTVEVRLSALPAHVRTARLVATAVARRAGLDEAVLDELRLAVGEACSRAVELHRQHCPAELVGVRIVDDEDRLVVEVADCAPAVPAPAGNSYAGPYPGLGSGLDELSGVLGRAVLAGDTDGQLDSEVDALPAGVGLAVISGLVDSLVVEPTSSGLRVRMSWPLAGAGPLLD